MDPLSFIILRYVARPDCNVYWNICLAHVRRYYPSVPVYIIDDHSPVRPVFTGLPKFTVNTTVINSELPPGRGEFLPYYYFHNRRLSENTVILHDTVFLNAPIPGLLLRTKSYHFLWTASTKWDRQFCGPRILDILRKMDGGEELLRRYQTKDGWDVCFGAMAILNLDHITDIFRGTNHLAVLASEIHGRRDRMRFERLAGLLLTQRGKTKAVNGSVSQDQRWGQTLAHVANHIRASRRPKRMYKVWVGR